MVCGVSVVPKVQPWTARCPSCGTWTSDLAVEINQHNRHIDSAVEIDTDARVVGLEALRKRNFTDILDGIEALRPLGDARLLDVGSAHGWFLDAALERGCTVTGAEPEAAVAAEPLARGLDVRVGYFPDVVRAGEQFDVITFNDVLEHIPDAGATVEACLEHLAPGGVLSINIPNADGLGYHAASALARVGVTGPYRRFWQQGLPSPHQHYFPRAALARLVTECGFEVRGLTPLTSILRDGLWERVHTFRRVSPASVASFIALFAAAPMLNRPSRSDIVLLLAQRPDA